MAQYIEYCWHCLDKDKKPLEVKIPKTQEMTKEFKAYLEESKEKYGSEYIIKRVLHHGCPNCNRDIIVHPAGYLDFYYPSKEKKEAIKKAAEEITENIKESIIEDMPEKAEE